MSADGRRPGLVIFDCDGVLVDSERISNDVLARGGWGCVDGELLVQMRG